MNDKQSAVLAGRVRHMVQRAEAGGSACFTGFLNLTEQSVVRQALGGLHTERTLFFGGHPAGERVVFGVFPCYEEPSEEAFPIGGLHFSYRPSDKLSHRDFLGAVLHLGLSRETVGDILVGEGMAAGFFTDAAAALICHDLKKVGNCGVQVRPLTPQDGLPEQQFAEELINVPSRRLDAVVAAVWKLSREKASQLIKEGLVQRDGLVLDAPSKQLPEHCILSVRGYGKARIEEDVRRTRRDRLCILCKRYQ